MGKTKMKKKLIIIGATEFAEIAYEYFEKGNEYKVVCFTVDSKFLNKNELKGLPIVPFEKIADYFSPEDCYMFTAITYGKLNRVREKFYLCGKEKGYKFASYVSPNAFVWDNVEVGEDTFVFEDNTLQYNVKIGNGVILWSGNHIGHSTVVEDYCFISSHVVISGYCRIGAYSFCGVNATMGNNLVLPANSVMAAGVVMTHSPLEEGRVYVGNPCKEINKTSFQCIN